jgi:hypothetical protein
MTQIPPAVPPPPAQPGYAYGATIPPRRSNALAIISLILGILGCVPVITGVGAIIFGALGISSSNKHNTGGKGMAIAGIILGLISLVLWGLFGSAIFAFVSSSAQPRAIAKQFATHIGNGNAVAAQAMCSSNVTSLEIADAIATAKSYGPLKDTALFGVNVNSISGVSHWKVAGSATFGNKPMPYEVDIDKTGSTYQITAFSLGAPPTKGAFSATRSTRTP